MDKEIEFEVEQTPTFPTQGSSGRAINGRLIRAMMAQHEAARECNQRLDELIRVVRGAQRTAPPRAARQEVYRAVSDHPEKPV